MDSVSLKEDSLVDVMRKLAIERVHSSKVFKMIHKRIMDAAENQTKEEVSIEIPTSEIEIETSHEKSSQFPDQKDSLFTISFKKGEDKEWGRAVYCLTEYHGLAVDLEFEVENETYSKCLTVTKRTSTWMGNEKTVFQQFDLIKAKEKTKFHIIVHILRECYWSSSVGFYPEVLQSAPSTPSDEEEETELLNQNDQASEVKQKKSFKMREQLESFTHERGVE